MKTMEELFHALLQDVYYAEKQLTKALPKMAKEADDSELKKAFTDHLKETEGHVERLDQAFKIIGKPAKGKNATPFSASSRKARKSSRKLTTRRCLMPA